MRNSTIIKLKFSVIIFIVKVISMIHVANYVYYYKKLEDEDDRAY